MTSSLNANPTLVLTRHEYDGDWDSFKPLYRVITCIFLF